MKITGYVVSALYEGLPDFVPKKDTALEHLNDCLKVFFCG
jgi:hypothetical protein